MANLKQVSGGDSQTTSSLQSSAVNFSTDVLTVQHRLINNFCFATIYLLLLQWLYLAGHIKVSDYGPGLEGTVTVVGIFIARTKLSLNDLRGVPV